MYGLCLKKQFMCSVIMRNLIIAQFCAFILLQNHSMKWQVTDMKRHVVLKDQKSVVRQTDRAFVYSFLS